MELININIKNISKSNKLKLIDKMLLRYNHLVHSNLR